MRPTLPTLRGLALLFLLVSSSACAPRVVVRAEPAPYPVPVLVPLPERLTRAPPAVEIPLSGSNGDLEQVASDALGALGLCRAQVEEIRTAQPPRPQE